MKPAKKRGRPSQLPQSSNPSGAATAATTPVDGMDVEDDTAQLAAAAIEEPEVVRKEFYIACALLCSHIDQVCPTNANWYPRVSDHEYDAPPSLKPAKKYCDVTGLEAPYTDPKSRLRYHNADNLVIAERLTLQASLTLPRSQLLKSFTSGSRARVSGSTRPEHHDPLISAFLSRSTSKCRCTSLTPHAALQLVNEGTECILRLVPVSGT